MPTDSPQLRRPGRAGLALLRGGRLAWSSPGGAAAAGPLGLSPPFSAPNHSLGAASGRPVLGSATGTQRAGKGLVLSSVADGREYLVLALFTSSLFLPAVSVKMNCCF